MRAVIAPPLLRVPADPGRPGALVAWTATVVRVLIAGIWVWAAIPKLESPAGSAAAVRAFRMFPEWLVKTIGYGLPFVGAGLAVLLAAGLATRLAATLSAVVIATFAVGVATAAARGLDILCGFLDVGGTLPFGQSAPYLSEIVRDDLLLLALGFLFWAGPGRLALDNRLGRRRTQDWLPAELRGRWRPETDRRIPAGCLAALALLLTVGLAIQSSRVG